MNKGLLVSIEESLPEMLANCKSAEERKQCIQKLFPESTINIRLENKGYWIIAQNSKFAVLHVESSKLIAIPHEMGSSEYFGVISIFPIETDSVELVAPLLLVMGGEKNSEGSLENISFAGTLDADTKITPLIFSHNPSLEECTRLIIERVIQAHTGANSSVQNLLH